MRLYNQDFDQFDDEGLHPVFCHRCGELTCLNEWSESLGHEECLCCGECGCATSANQIFKQVFECKFAEVLLEYCRPKEAIEIMIDFYRNYG